MLIVNLFGAPGAGKSTLAAYIFAKLKMAGVNAELVTEFAKDKTWENNHKALANQVYVFGKQLYRITRCQDDVDVIVTDSPLLLSVIYNHSDVLGEDFNNLVYKVFNSYDNANYFINRVKKYNPKGRSQTEEESDDIAIEVKEMLSKYCVDYTEADGILESADVIADTVLHYYLKR